MDLFQQLVAAGNIMLATFLSMVLGLNRERREKDAGLRTHMLVGAGACLFTSLSMLAFPEADPARMAANVVTGVGFLGAGVIWRGEDKVHDLTTAASIWVTAALGAAVGTGAWFLAICGTVIVWTTLEIFWRLRRRAFNSDDPDD